MRLTTLIAFGLLSAAAPALAAGDPVKGEADFKKCKACHSVIAPDGAEIVKGGKVGPNLFGVVGRAAAATDYAYSDSLKALGAKGQVWDEAAIAAYLADPGAYLKQALGDPAARSKMTFKLAKGGEDIAAWLGTLK